MSSEVEGGKEENEETKEPPKTIKQKLNENWQIVLKIIQIILCVTCLVLMFEPTRLTGLGKSHLHHVGFMYTTYAGFILINCILLVSRYMHEGIGYRTSMLVSVCGASMFLITAILLLSDRSHLMKNYFYHPNAYLIEMLTSSVIFAFVNMLVFLIEAIFVFRRQEDF